MYLSIVTASRLDNYAGKQIERLEFFVNYLSFMSNKYWSKLQWELLFVDWNISTDDHKISNLDFFNKLPNVKFVNVFHDDAKNFYGPNNLSFRLYHALNRGFNSASGKFVISTTTDCFFSKEIFEFIARKKIKRKVIYLSDRLDSSIFKKGLLPYYNSIFTQVSNADTNLISDLLTESDGILQRRHRYIGSEQIPISIQYKKNDISKMSQLNPKLEDKSLYVAIWKRRMGKISIKWLRKQYKIRSDSNLIHQWITKFEIHTNACGDFILTDKRSLLRINGFDENDLNMQHMDSDLILRLIKSGVRHAIFLPPAKVLHWITEGSGGTDKRYIEARTYEDLCSIWLKMLIK